MQQETKIIEIEDGDGFYLKQNSPAMLAGL